MLRKIGPDAQPALPVLVKLLAYVPEKGVADALRSRVRDTGKTDLIIRVDDEAVQEALVAVIDAGNEAGMERIRIADEVPPEAQTLTGGSTTP